MLWERFKSVFRKSEPSKQAEDSDSYKYPYQYFVAHPLNYTPEPCSTVSPIEWSVCHKHFSDINVWCFSNLKGDYVVSPLVFSKGVLVKMSDEDDAFQLRLHFLSTEKYIDNNEPG